MSEIEWEVKYIEACEDKRKMRIKIQELQEENRKLRDCVEFYADKGNWVEICIDGGISNTPISDGDFVDCLIDVVDNGYSKAKQTLKELGF